MKNQPIEQHNSLFEQCELTWNNKLVLRNVYNDFYTLIKENFNKSQSGKVVEIGSGIGKIKGIIPECITTDIFANSWLDQVEDAYNLSFAEGTVSHLVMLDVFHHLEFPGSALAEFNRVLKPGGRVIILEPDMSLLGRIVYGVVHKLFHKESLGFKDPIRWMSDADIGKVTQSYFAAQAAAYRIFIKKENNSWEDDFFCVKIKRYSNLAYILSGGFFGPKLYPDYCYIIVAAIDLILGKLPSIFSARLFIVLEKKASK